MALNRSSVWRPAAVLSAVAIALALLTASSGNRATAATQQAFGDYIVRFRPDAVERPAKPGLSGLPQAPNGPQLRELPRGAAVRLSAAYGGRLGHVYEYALQGFSVSLPPAVAALVARDPSVLSIEPDGPVSINDAPGTQAPTPSWGLDRIDQRGPVGGATSYSYPNTGVGVTAYIIDTGVLKTHNDFGGRVSGGYDFVDNDADPTDCNGHGTHVAGTVGGSTYGVAKGVSIVPVRVLDCTGSGTWSGVIAGINWVTQTHATGAPAVANMSLGGGASSAVDAAIESAIADGVTFAVAAGNNSLNACSYSPARTPNALTVGATTSSDARASYSNYGSCLDIFAPGSSITSDWSTSNSATNILNGTSMATPHVAGAAALYLATNPSAAPAAVASALISAATINAVSSAGSGSPNRLLFMGTSAPAPTTGTVTGRVTTQAGGAGISSATVTIDSGQSTATNSSGYYTLSNVPTGSRTVTASRSGFVTSVPTPVTVNANATSTLDIALAAVPACTATVTSDSDTSGGGGTVIINWTNGPGVTQVQIQRRLTSNIWSTRGIWTSGPTTFSGSDSSSDPQWRLVPRCGGVDYPGTAFDPS